MKRMLFNATQAEELRVAIVDGQELIDLDIETIGKEQRKGNIYKGTITRIEPSLEACFVDYGTDRHGFLPFKEISRSYFKDYNGGRARIQEVISEGTEVIIQVEKDERGNKGAALTTFTSLAGRYLVLMPNNPRGGGVSRRIEGDERQALKDAMRQLNVPQGMSLIARTAGIGRTVEELEWDLGYLLQLWTAIESAGNALPAPNFLLKESSLVVRALRDYFQPDIGEILVDTEEVFQDAYEFVKNVMPQHLSKIKQYKDHTPLFSRYQIEHQIESAFSRSVSLPSGGAIVIDHTEALVSVDVNSARATRGADIEDTAFKTNVEAAEEIARQLRLRDLGGLVVIDFIDMENNKNQRELEQTLRSALRYDRARIQMDKLSRFGLLELSRQRLRSSLGETSYISCPRCHGTGFIRGIESSALHILRIVQEEAMKENTGEIHAQVPVEVATFLLNEKRTELFVMEEHLNVRVILIPNIHLETPHYNVTRVRSDDVDENLNPSYKLVEKPEEEETLSRLSDKIKSEQQSAAIKGISRTQPAPTVQAVSFFGGIANWFKKVFKETPPEPVKQPVKNRPTNNNNKRNNNQNDRNRRNNNRLDKDDTEKTANTQKQRPRNNNNRNKPKDALDQNKKEIKADNVQENVVENNNVNVANVTAEKDNNNTVSNNNRRRRNNRRDRKVNEQTDKPENNVVQPVSTEQKPVEKAAESAPVVKTDVEKAPVKLENSTPPTKKANQNRTPRKPRISGEEADLAQAVQYAKNAITKVLGELEESNAPKAPVMEQISTLVEVTTSTASNVENIAKEADLPKAGDSTIVMEKEVSVQQIKEIVVEKQEIFDPSSMDLGGLVMVQTNANSAQVEDVVVTEENVIRRAALPKLDEETTQPKQVLQQVETIK